MSHDLQPAAAVLTAVVTIRRAATGAVDTYTVLGTAPNVDAVPAATSEADDGSYAPDSDT